MINNWNLIWNQLKTKLTDFLTVNDNQIIKKVDWEKTKLQINYKKRNSLFFLTIAPIDRILILFKA